MTGIDFGNCHLVTFEGRQSNICVSQQISWRKLRKRRSELHQPELMVEIGVVDIKEERALAEVGEGGGEEAEAEDEVRHAAGVVAEDRQVVAAAERQQELVEEDHQLVVEDGGVILRSRVEEEPTTQITSPEVNNSKPTSLLSQADNQALVALRFRSIEIFSIMPKMRR